MVVKRHVRKSTFATHLRFFWKSLQRLLHELWEGELCSFGGAWHLSQVLELVARKSEGILVDYHL
jgi:hypothetical protein